MPLTPTDVANKQFRIAFRGYSLDEVDAFLDEVETELSRLLRDNAELKSRPATAAVPAPAAPQSAAAAQEAPAAAPAPAPLGGMEGQEAALRTLLLAQRTADEAIAEARAEAEQILTAARSEADTTLTSARSEAESALSSAKAEAERTLAAARSEADTTLTGAREEAESTLTAARSEAESTLSTSQAKARSIDQDVAARISAATGDLDERRRSLEQRIEELRVFEREYRTRLKAYLEGQLRDLDSRSGPEDGGAGVPAGNRSAAVAGSPAVRGGTPAPGVAPAAAPATAPATDGPPRDAGSSLRAVPPLSSSTPGAVGPFTVVPSATGDAEDDRPSTDRRAPGLIAPPLQCTRTSS